MEIVRVLNNNVVMTQESGKMTLLMGLSIGFKKRPGDLLDEKRIEKSFVLTNPDTWTRLHDLLLSIPDCYLDFASDMMELAQQALNRQMSDTLLITLTDHIHASVERYQRGIVLKNPLLWDIRRFYQDEFNVAQTILKKINQSFGTQFEEDEAGFIAFHLASAEMDETGQVAEITRLMGNLIAQIKNNLQIVWSEGNTDYQRLITHLKFFAQRVLNGCQGQSGGEDELLEVLKSKYPSAYSCARKLCAYTKKQYGYEACPFDLLSLTMHIARLMGGREGKAVETAE